MTGQDKTAYCRALGYTGRRPVRVLDGKVVSHRDADWFEFCHRLERNAARVPQT